MSIATNIGRVICFACGIASRHREFTELVPLPFVHMEAPIFLKGRSRSGPAFREAILMHAIGRLGAASPAPEYPDVLGQDGRRWRAHLSAGRRQ